MTNIYQIGKNNAGEFGSTSSNTTLSLTLCTEPKDACNITAIHCGDEYCIYADMKNQKFWVAGNNSNNQCGVVSTSKIIIKSELNKYFSKNNIIIKKVCTNIGGWSTFWITNKNELYANGWNNKNQLGLGDKTSYIPSLPTLIKQLSTIGHLPIYDVKSATQYSLALCLYDIRIITKYFCKAIVVPHDIINLLLSFHGVTSKVYSTCCSAYGGNGHFRTYYHGKWEMVEALKDKQIVKIGCGTRHSLFLEANGTLWSCGFNKNGEAASNSNNNVSIPIPIRYFELKHIKIKDIACGWNHNLAIDIDNKIWSWGKNNCGQCGNNTTINVTTPILIPALKNYNIKYIKCGALHSYAMTQNDQHFLWGSNKQNESKCIPSDTKILLEPFLINHSIKQQIDNKRIESVFLGNRNTQIIVKK